MSVHSSLITKQNQAPPCKYKQAPPTHHAENGNRVQDRSFCQEARRLVRERESRSSRYLESPGRGLNFVGHRFCFPLLRHCGNFNCFIARACLDSLVPRREMPGFSSFGDCGHRFCGAGCYRLGRRCVAWCSRARANMNASLLLDYGANIAPKEITHGCRSVRMKGSCSTI